MAQRVPGLEGHVLAGQELLEGMLVPVGVDLDLEHRRHDGGHVQDLLDLVLREVRKANGAHLARGHRLLHGLPGLGVRAVGLVEQQQVEVVHVQAAQRGVDVLFALLVGVALGKQLGGAEELLARDAAAVDHA